MLACGAVVGGILLWWLGSYMGFWGSQVNVIPTFKIIQNGEDF